MDNTRLNSFCDGPDADRYNAVRNMIDFAIEQYAKLERAGAQFDSNSDGSHLGHWRQAINEFANEQGWRK
jgi:hypothetical protein